MRYLITGASGFVGNAVCKRLLLEKHNIIAPCRSNNLHFSDANLVATKISELDQYRNWREMLNGVDAILHLAARVHVMNETANNPLEKFRKINVNATLELARQAAESRVKRFVYVSSIKVNGDESSPGKPFTANDEAFPNDPYALSKHEAEVALKSLCATNDMELVVIRPPLVYGPGVKGNFLRLLKLVESGIPLPFALLTNVRCMVALQNLVDLLVLCLQHPSAASKVFLVSDREGWIIPELIRNIAHYMNLSNRLFPLPEKILRLTGYIAGQTELISRFCSPLELDVSKTCEILSWKPPQTKEEALRQTVNWYLNRNNA